MGSSPLVFTGISTFSNDLQTILTRTVSIAQLPVKRLQNQQADLLQQKQLLIALNPAVTNLASSLVSLGTVAANRAVAASSSDATKVSVVNTGATSAASYAITDISSLATAASETSLTGYADAGATAVSSSGKVRLVYGSKSYDISLTSQTNNLAGVRDAINNLGVGVSASILTTGTGQNPNYLSLSAGATGTTTLQVLDVPSDPQAPPVNLLTANNQGSNASFKLNGVAVSRASNVVNDVVSGVSFTLLGTTAAGQTVNVSVATDRSQLANAIQSFAQNYNALVDQVDAQIGPAAGKLSGDIAIRNISDDLRQLASYQGSGSIRSLSDLGVTFDASGKIAFDASTFNAVPAAQLGDAFKFFGASKTGFSALAGAFSQIGDPSSGVIRAEEDGIARQNAQLTSRIDTLTRRVTDIQTAESGRLQRADALLAQLESRQKLVASSVQSVDLALFGPQTTVPR
jgi:flagellar hook-associated protein 2